MAGHLQFSLVLATVRKLLPPTEWVGNQWCVGGLLWGSCYALTGSIEIARLSHMASIFPLLGRH